MKQFKKYVLILSSIVVGAIIVLAANYILNTTSGDTHHTNSTGAFDEHIDSNIEEGVIEVEEQPPISEKNESSQEFTVYDAIVEGARKDVANRSRYKDAYYAGGYPPEDEGVCTDLVWRALKHAGYNLKEMMDEDIKENTSLYPRVGGVPEPNIDFRRVPNQEVFFSRFGKVLTNEINPNDPDNLKEWQPGDIVSIRNPEHIGIISDKRNARGVPYVIHNMGSVPREDDCLERWSGRIVGHFRFPKEE